MRPNSSKANEQMQFKLKNRDSVKVHTSSLEAGSFADHKNQFGGRQNSSNIGVIEGY